METESTESQQPANQQPPMSTPAAKTSLAIPVAIIVGFGLIAAAIFFSSGAGGTGGVTINTDPAPQPTAGPEAIEPVTEADHIRGNPNAPIVLVEYSDYDCPFCKNFHESMNRIMSEYGTDGKVAWVYRHFPLEQLHPNAPQISLASECVANLAGNDAFWAFSDLVFGERGTNEPTNLDRLEEFAVTAGAEAGAFNTCFSEGTYMSDVEADFNNGLAIGARGTPHTVVLVGDQQGVINGAQPYNVVKQIVDDLIGQIEGGE